MLELLNYIDAEILLFMGLTLLIIAFILLISFFWKRIANLLGTKRKGSSFTAGIINFLLILVFLFFSAVLFSTGLFLKSYKEFNSEVPVAEIKVFPDENSKNFNIQISLNPKDKFPVTKTYTLNGEQWMLEADFIKWIPTMTMMGYKSGYRLTRIRGRYINTQDEINNKVLAHPLTEEEESEYWKFLYRFGYQIPFISSVYGSATFQNAQRFSHYMVYITEDGLITRIVK